MKDQSKTKQSLIQELASLREKITELEKSEAAHKKPEKTSREREELFRNNMENAPDGVYMSDMKGTFIYGNRKCEEIIGYKREELIGKNFLELNLLTEKSLNKAVQLLQVNMEGKPTGPDEIELINKEGRLIPVEINTSVVQRMGEGIVLAFVRDITDRKRAEDNLKESEKKYRLLADNIQDVVFFMDMNLNYTYISPSVKLLRGYEPEEAMKHTPAETLTPSSLDLALSIFFEILEMEKSEHKELNISRTAQLEMSRKDGTTVWVETKASIVRDENQRAVGIMGVTRDITEGKLAENVLRQSEEKYRTILEDIQEGYFEVDLAGNFTFFNDSLSRYFDFSKEELMGMNYRQYTDKEHSKKLFQAFNKVYSTGEPIDGFDWQIIRKEGTKRYAEASVSLQKDLSGKPIGFRGIARDITEHKKVEEALKKNEEQYRLLADNMTAHIWLMDLNTRRMIYVSPSVEKMYGYTLDEIPNISLKKLLTAESLQKTLDAFSTEMPKALANPLPYVHKYSLEMEACHKDGHPFWIKVDNSIIRDKNGKPAYLLGETRDITERKRAEEELRENEERFRSMIQSLSDIIFILDGKGQLTYESPSATRILGYQPGYFIGKSPFTHIHPDDLDQVMKDLDEVFLSLNPGIPTEFRYQKADGTWIYLEVLGNNQFENPGIQGIVLTVRDITTRKQGEEKLQQTLDSLRKAVGTTIQVLSTASETRDPYTAGHQKRVSDLARVIATEMGLDQEKIEGIHMAGIIHDIGKLSIPAEILSKPTRLTDIEFSLIKEHSRSGYEMLKDVESPWPLAQIVYEHHERMDGSGYPRNLKGNEILIESRIMAVADVVEAMASYRPYRPALGIEAALEEIEKNKGILYDDTVTDACLRSFREKGYQFT